MPDTPHAVWKDFCRLAEHHDFVRKFGHLSRVLEKFAIFEFSAGQSDEVFASTISPDAEFPVPPFPFPKLALVFEGHLVFLEEPVSDGVRLQCRAMLFMGLESQREVFARCTIDLDIEASLRAGEFVAEARDVESICRDADGTVRDYFGTELARLDDLFEGMKGTLGGADLEDYRSSIEGVRTSTRGLLEREASILQRFFVTGLHAIAWLNLPKHYIVERGPDIVRKASAKGSPERVPRFGERARFILLSHGEIKSRWGESQGTHASPMPHLRRGHFKTLRAERFKENRGKVIWVSPCHVNGACVEWRDGNVAYKVVG